MLPHKPELDLEDEDDSLLDLPETSDDDEDEDDDDEEADWEPDDDSDLELDELDDVGLDMETGTDELGETELVLDEEEPGSWLDDGRPAASDDADDPDVAEDPDEDALTEGSEPAGDSGAEDWDADELELDDGEGLAADAGEEGFGDEAFSGELDLDRLPPLDDSAATESDDPEIEAFAALLPDELEEVAAELSYARFPGTVRIELLRRNERQALHAVNAVDAVGLAWDGALCVAEPRTDTVERRFVSAEKPFALAAAKTIAGIEIALALPSGVLYSRDAGHTFASVAPPSASAKTITAVAITADAAADVTRLWAASPHGSLWASDDRGASFRCVRDDIGVLALRCTDARTLIVLGRAQDGSPCCLRSDDGETFIAVALAASEVEIVQDLQACREITLCCRRAPAPQLVWQRQRGGANPWLELAAHAAAPALLLEEDGVVNAYFFSALDSGMLMLRRALSPSNAPAQLVTAIDADAGLPLQLAGTHQDGLTTLQLGTERGWYRLSLRLDGSPRG